MRTNSFSNHPGFILVAPSALCALCIKVLCTVCFLVTLNPFLVPSLHQVFTNLSKLYTKYFLLTLPCLSFGHMAYLAPPPNTRRVKTLNFFTFLCSLAGVHRRDNYCGNPKVVTAVQQYSHRNMQKPIKNHKP